MYPLIWLSWLVGCGQVQVLYLVDQLVYLFRSELIYQKNIDIIIFNHFTICTDMISTIISM